ncbi:hypothetical protein FA95DRAFT_1348803 [Auriscalpium vulgare]|uniref:Uncharacterized protein n=1 Tax=Auriscalpium vulgare TaxID=40419 RepID=A0ACB8R269_9AGAM|nr:hypothetical protein FA95DRAFT_1348803 [Auriscalpium vulgare]
MSLSTGDNPSTFPSASRPLGHPLTQVDLESNSDLAHTDHAAFVSVMQTRLRILPRITRPKGPHDRADEHALGRAFVELERAYNDHWRMNSETERDPRVAYWFADVLFRLEGYACALEVIDDLRCLSSMRSAFLDETREMVVRAQAVQDARSVERLRLAMLHPAGQSYVYKPGNLAPLPDALPDLPGLIIPLVAPGAVSLAPDELTRLVRAISIHTNLIEGIFSLDLPSTCALVDHTFPAPDDLLRHGNNDPKYVQDVLIDTQEATQYVLDRARSDTTTICASTFVQALHRTITRTACVASYSGSEPGTRTSTYIGRGEFKRVSNHVFARTRKFHIYCPPQFVERELVTLLEMLKLYLEKPAPQPPYAYGLWLAAWFHHRFVNIHPFRDGNGRVTRCLTTGILTHYGFLPLRTPAGSSPWSSFSRASNCRLCSLQRPRPSRRCRACRTACSGSGVSPKLRAS